MAEEPLIEASRVMASIDHDQEVYDELVTIFLEDAPSTFREIVEHAETKDWSSVAQKAHLLVGMCLTVGAQRLAIVCTAIEQTPENVKRQVLRAAFQATLSALTMKRQQDEDPNLR